MYEDSCEDIFVSAIQRKTWKQFGNAPSFILRSSEMYKQCTSVNKERKVKCAQWPKNLRLSSWSLPRITGLDIKIHVGDIDATQMEHLRADYGTLKLPAWKMTITWMFIIKLNTGCRLHTKWKRPFHIGYPVVWTNGRKVTWLQKVLGCMDNQIFLPKVPLGDESFATTSMLSMQLLLFYLISGKCGWWHLHLIYLSWNDWINSSCMSRKRPQLTTKAFHFGKISSFFQFVQKICVTLSAHPILL